MDNKKVHVGEFVEIGFKLNNTGLLPVAYAEINCNIAEKLDQSNFPIEISFINPLQTINTRKKIRCRHRGYYYIGLLTVKISDLFHLFEKEIIFDKKVQLEVYPRIIDFKSLHIPATEFFGSVMVYHKTHEDFTNIDNLRKYTSDDNIRKVHWKVSAKLNDLFVKDYELSGSTRINIFLDGCMESYRNDREGEQEEKAVEVAASIIKYCLSKNLSTAFICQWKERSYVTGHNLSKLSAFIQELMVFSPNGGTPLEHVLTAESKVLPWGTTIAVITLFISDYLFKTFLQLKEKNFRIMVILIKHKRTAYTKEMIEIEEVLRNAGVHITKIDADPYTPDTVEV
ncbi:MAG: DUF58 domain-containing protein [Bacillota bacterium]